MQEYAGRRDLGGGHRELRHDAILVLDLDGQVGGLQQWGRDPAIEMAVARYAGPRGNLQFPLSEPMPLALIERIVKLRVKQDAAKVAAKRGKRSKASRKPRASE